MSERVAYEDATNANSATVYLQAELSESEAINDLPDGDGGSVLVGGAGHHHQGQMHLECTQALPEKCVGSYLAHIRIWVKQDVR